MLGIIFHNYSIMANSYTYRVIDGHTHTFMHNALVIKNDILHGNVVIVNLEIFDIEELSYNQLLYENIKKEPTLST